MTVISTLTLTCFIITPRIPVELLNVLSCAEAIFSIMVAKPTSSIERGTRSRLSPQARAASASHGGCLSGAAVDDLLNLAGEAFCIQQLGESLPQSSCAV